MASLQWINLLAVFCLVAQTSSSVIPQKRDDSAPETSSKPNSWIIQAPKRPLLSISGIGLPPAGMLLMTMDPNATATNQQQQEQQQQQQPLEQLESSSTTSVPSTSAIVTSEAPLTEASVSSSSPTVSLNLAEDVFTNPSVEVLAVTETLSTSTVGTEAVTEASSQSTSTREPEIITTEESNSETEWSDDLVTEIPDDSVTTTESLDDQTTDGEMIETTTDPWPTNTEPEENGTETTLETSTDYYYACKGSEKCFFYSTIAPMIFFEDVTTESATTLETEEVSDNTSGWTETTTESESGSDESTETVSDLLHQSAALISLDEPNAGSGADPDDGSDAPPDLIAFSDNSATDKLDPAIDQVSEVQTTDFNIPLTEPVPATLLVFTTEAVPEDPGLGELTTIVENVNDQRTDAPAAADNKELPAKNSRHLLSLDAKETIAKKGTEEEKVAVKSGDDTEEARQYRPYPIRNRMRPDNRPTIHRFDQNFRPEYDDYEDSNVIYRTYDYCYTLWCKFKTQLSRIGLL